MNHRAPLFLLVGVLFSGQGVKAQPTTATPPPKNNPPATPVAPVEPGAIWQPVTVREGNFSIIFPVSAKREGTRSQINMQDGSAIETRFTAPTAEANYQAAFTFLSDNIATPQAIRQRFEALLKNLKSSPKIQWISGGEIEHKGNPGIEIKIQLLDSKTIIWSRQYFAFGCLYELTARYAPRDPEPKELQIFLDSFNLFGPPTQRLSLTNFNLESLPDFTPLAQNLYYVSPETLRKQALQIIEPDFTGKAPFWDIRLRVTVSPEGKVTEVDSGDGFSSLHNEAIKTAKKWTFKPFLFAGKPVAVQGQLIFKSGRNK